MVHISSVFFSASILSAHQVSSTTSLTTQNNKMTACNQQCSNGYCVSDQQAHAAMAKHPELAERYVKETQHIRDALKMLVHADGSLTRLHWYEISLLMEKFGNDIALMHHVNFRNLAAPDEDLAEGLRSFNQAIWYMQEVMWVPDASPVDEYREWTVNTPPQLARFTDSQQSTAHHPMHSQNVRPLLPASQIPIPCPQRGITASQWELPPRRIQRSSSQVPVPDPWLPFASPSTVSAGTPIGGHLTLSMMAPSSQSPRVPADAAAITAANVSASESKGIPSPRRRRESDACTKCKLKKTGCGGRYKHCLKNPANIKPANATPFKKTRPHVQLNRRAAKFPNHLTKRPAFDGDFSQYMQSGWIPIPTAQSPSMTAYEVVESADGLQRNDAEGARALQHAKTFPSDIPFPRQNFSARQALLNGNVQHGVFSEPSGEQKSSFDSSYRLNDF